MKICTKCNKNKKRSEFFKRKSSKDGLNLWCKGCHVNNNNKWVKDNLDHVNKKQKVSYYADLDKIRNKELKHKFGITKSEYDIIHKSQDGKCKICNKPESTLGRNGKMRPLAVDHDHLNDKIRGLLCARCNTGIGLLYEDISILESAIKYIEQARTS